MDTNFFDWYFDVYCVFVLKNNIFAHLNVIRFFLEKNYETTH